MSQTTIPTRVIGARIMARLDALRITQTQLAKAAGVHMGRKKGADPVQLAKVKAGLDAKMSVKQIVAMTGISLATVKRYRATLTIEAEKG